MSYFARLDSQEYDGQKRPMNARTKFEEHICRIISKPKQLADLSLKFFKHLLVR